MWASPADACRLATVSHGVGPAHAVTETKTPSKLATTRAAGAERLARLEEAAQASGRWGPLVVMARRIGRHELIDRGAALTYYSVLSLVPGVLVLFAVIGLFGDQGTIEEVSTSSRTWGRRTAKRPRDSRSNP